MTEHNRPLPHREGELTTDADGFTGRYYHNAGRWLFLRELPDADEGEHGFDVEFNQVDPPDSPSPDLGHHAGFKFFRTLEEARAFAHPVDRFIGKPVPPDCWAPCCDWQLPDTPVSSVVIISYPGGDFFEEFTGSATTESEATS